MSLLDRPPSVVLGANHESDPTDDAPRQLRRIEREDIAELLGSAVAALAIQWLLLARLLPMEGAPAAVLIWYISFLVIYRFVAAQHHGKLAGKDRLATVVLWSFGLIVIGALLLIIGYIVVRGAGNLRLNFFTDTLKTTGPLAPATEGGGLHSIVGTAMQVGIGLVIAVPLALITAVYLSEVGGRLERPVRFVIDAMSGIPSIVAGLFVFVVWISASKTGYSGFAAGLALSILMLPTIARTSMEMLRLVADGYREAALALGAPRWRVTWNIVIPTARSGLVTALILGVARAVGETAPLLLTAFGASVLNTNPFSGAQDDLPLFIYKQVRLFKDAPVDRAFTGAFVLLVFVLIAFVSARLIGGRARARR